jgi:site-specific DNA recombinase
MSTARLIPYMRKSSGEDPTGSLERQRRAIRAWAELNKVELAPEVWEPGVSGKTPWQQRGLGLAIEAVGRGEAAGIVCEEQSRMSREKGLQTAEVWDALQRVGARLVCVAEGMDTASSDQELNFSIRAALAREQWKQYQRRSRANVERANRLGYQIARMPLGYRKDEHGRIEVDPATAPLVREVFERRASGAGWNPLADYLTEVTGRRWPLNSVRELVRNDLYKGVLRHGDLISEWSPGAVVDEALWAAAQRRTTHDPRASRSDGFYLLSGLARCGACGYALNPNRAGTRKDGSERLRYVCRNRQCPTPRPQIEARRLERYVEIQTKAVAHEFTTRAHAPDLSALEDAVTAAKRRLDWMTTPEAVDGLAEMYGAAVKQYREAHDAALAALGEARQQSGVAERSFDLGAVWDDLPPSDRREALRLFWKEIRVGRREGGSQPVTLVARGPGGETELDL